MLFLHFAFAFDFSALALFAANDNFGLDLVLLKSVSDPIQALYASILHGSAALDSLSAPALDSVGAAALMRATQDDVELAVEQELVEVPVVVELTTQNASAFEWPKLDFDADLDGSASATVGGRCTLISALLALVSGGCLMVFVYIQRSIAPTSLAPVIRAAAAPVFIASISVSPAAAAAPAAVTTSSSSRSSPCRSTSPLPLSTGPMWGRASSPPSRGPSSSPRPRTKQRQRHAQSTPSPLALYLALLTSLSSRLARLVALILPPLLLLRSLQVQLLALLALLLAHDP